MNRSSHHPARAPGPRGSIRGARPRHGAILTAELIIVMPLVVGVALVIIQFILLSSAKHRVEAAAMEGVRLAALGESHAQVHQGVGLVLSPHLSGAYETKLQYQNAPDDGNPEINEKDWVIVQIRIPQATVGHDWLGFFGGTVNDLHLRSVVKKRIEAGVVIRPES